jgi:hypothetical protein
VRGDGPRAACTTDADVSATAIQDDPVGGMRVSRFENQLIVRLICGKVNHNADGFDLALHSVGRVESPLVFLYAGFRAAEPKIKAGGERSAEA